jgi:hypothetical protein
MRRLAVLSVLACAMGGTWATADSTVNVTPSNMNEWTLNSFDGNGTIVNSGPYYGTAAMTTGPATPPIGTGSAHLATPAGAADGAAAIATESYDTTLLSSITSLSYSTYDVTNNGQQFPYLAISIDTGAIDNSGNGNTNQLDTLFFEPPYQQGTATGNGSLPVQATPQQGEWQTWNAFVGGYWDNGFGSPIPIDQVGNPGTGVEPLTAFLAAYPDATIANGGLPGLGGIAMQVGFESSGDTEDGYVDNFTIGINGVNTTYNFDPDATVPLPASAWSGLALLGGLGLLGGVKRMRRQII